jgi:hypothetical protein
MLAILKSQIFCGLSMVNRDNLTESGIVSLKLVIASFLVFISVVVLVSAYFSARSQGANQNRLADVVRIQEALKIYFEENGRYPSGTGTPNGFSDYLDFWPTPPSTSAGDCRIGGDRYNYSQRSLGDDYTLSFCLSKSAGGLSSGIHTVTSRGILN